MREYTIKLYSIDELSEDVREKIYSDFRCNDPDLFHWSDEWIDSLKSFCHAFNTDLKDFEISLDRPSHYRIDIDPDIAELKGKRLYAYIVNNFSQYLDESCPFTGFCADENALDPIYDYVKKPNLSITYHDLITDCIESLIKAMLKDWEYCLSDGHIHELCQINEYEFTENGDFF